MHFVAIILSLLVICQLGNAQLACTNCACTDRDYNTALTRGDTAPLCVQFISKNGSIFKAAFALVVDQYSALVISDSKSLIKCFLLTILAQNAFVNSNTAKTYTEITIQTDSNNKAVAMPFSAFNNSDGSLSFYGNLYSVVVRLDSGKVTSIQWDNTCDLCSGSSCYTTPQGDGSATNICNVVSSCSFGTSTTCNPKIYVSWIGTDASGSTLTSAGMRLSLFVQYSISGLYANAQSIVSTTVSNAQSAASSVSVGSN